MPAIMLQKMVKIRPKEQINKYVTESSKISFGVFIDSTIGLVNSAHSTVKTTPKTKEKAKEVCTDLKTLRLFLAPKH